MSEKAELQAIKPRHGQFCWKDLATNNLQICKTFYSELFGWSLTKSDAGGMDYFEFAGADGQPFGGMWEMNENCGGEMSAMPPPHWMSYIAVDDVDVAAAKATELGGSVCVPPTDIPNVGRFAVINDPTGATFSLLTIN